MGSRAVGVPRHLARWGAAASAVFGLAVSCLLLSPGSLAEANMPTAWSQASPTPPPIWPVGTYAPTTGEHVPHVPNPRVLADVNPMPRVGTHFPSDSLFEPAVAVSPFDSRLVAVIYQRRGTGSPCGLDTGIAISRDGGMTWRNAAGRPWSRSKRGPNYHAVLAWGPGPTEGSSRLWWADTTVSSCKAGTHLMSIGYSDNLGATWSRLYVETRTPPWIGGYTDITVDSNPASPNFGVVYAAYNWPADERTGPGMAILASGDNGASWQMVQVPPVGLAGYPATWRIGYRIRTAPDGTAWVASSEADMRRWNSKDPFASGGTYNVGRVGFTVARIHYDRGSRALAADPPVWVATSTHNGYTVIGWPAPGTSELLLPEPKWEIGLDVDQSTGRVYLAVSDFYVSPTPAHARGVVRVGYSDDGITWQWRTLDRLPDVSGRSQSAIKPTLAARNGIVFVGFHGLTDVSAGAKSGANVGTYYAFSYDGGQTYATPLPVSNARWDPKALEGNPNGTGLRERADFGPDGLVRFAYGDGRLAAANPGKSAVFVALIDPDW